MIINSKFAYVKKKETFEPLITTIPKGLNPIVFIEDTREMWTCGTYFSIGYPSIEISESSGSVKVSIGNSFFLLSTAGESISVRKGDGNRIIISSNALNRVDTEPPLEWNVSDRKLLHMDSGVAPGSYGQSTSLGNASVFIVPNIMVDSTGHITYAQNYNVEIRDYVEQLAPSTLAGNRNVLLSYNADSESMDTSQVRKANGLLFNDSTRRLTVEGGIDTNGAVFVNHGDLSVLDGYIIGHLKGDVEGEAKPKIHLSNKPEYGGASINLYGHVKLQDILNNKPEPSSDNENINDPNITNAIAASPLMVWNAIQTAKDYADSILGSNNAMLYKGSIEAGITYPGTYTPIGQIGNTYVVTFGSGNYIDSVGYVNGEPVEVGDLIICKEETPAATSTTWETVKSKWTYVQTNNTGVVSGPSSSTIGQLAVFNNTKGKLIKGLPNGNVGQILSIDESGIPAWVNKPDRLNFALSFQVRGTEFIAFDGYEPKKVNFIAGDNMFITSDMQGNLTLAADPGSDTVNTAGATNNPNTKLFLIGAESQTTAPQTYSNQYVYIGPDNKLYSNGKEVSTTDHNHDDRYVNVIGDTMTGTLSITCSDTYPLVLNNSSGHLAIIIKNANTNKSRFGWNQEYGSYIYDYTADKYINIKSDSLYWNNSNPFLHTGNYATTLDTRYVKKSGDSMSGVLSITTSDIHPLVITSSNEQETSINIASKGTIGYHSSKGIFLYNKTANKTLEINNDGSILFDGNKVWHAGNDGPNSGLNADTLDDVDLTNIVHYAPQNSYDNTSCSRIIPISNIDITDSARYGSIFQWTNITTQTPAQTGTTSNWFNQLYGATNNRIYFRTRTNGGSWTPWNKLAYITDNVASATKLQTARTLWGKSFDGTANVDGCIRIQANEGSYCEGIRIKPRNSWTTILLGGDDLTSDTGTSANSWSIHNNNGKFYINKNNSSGSTGSELCNINGNWGIGTVSPSYKLHVGGNAYITSGLTSGGDIILNQNGSTGTRQLRIQCGDNDYGRIAAGATAANTGWLEIATADDGNEPIYVRQYTGVYSAVKRTLTLLDGSGNTGIPGSLTVAGTTTSGNFNTGGRYISNYASNTYINSVTNAVLTCNYSGYGGILCAPVKGGRITLSTYPSNDNMVYLGYATSSQISAGTNALNKQTRWNADNGYWYTDGYVKNGSSDSYVLLGGGGHTLLSSLGGSHTHTVLKNNLMIKGTNGISDSASIHLGIGDSDTGFKWISDGVCQMYANNKAIGQWNSGGMNWYYTPQVNGVAVSLSNHTHTYIVSSGLRNATANGNTRGESGVRLYSCYNNSYPISYGAVLHLHEGRGAAELLLGWSGTDGAHAENYIRSKRDNDSGAWSGWAKIWTSANLDVSTYFKYQGNNVNADWNGVTTTGNMRVTQQTITNGPSNAYNYGQLLTFNAGGTLSQIYLPHSNTGGMYIRTGWSGASQYYGWIQVLTTGNYTSFIGNSFIKKAGDTMTGALNFANNVWNKVGDDVYIGDHNQANYLCVKANSGSTVGINFFNSSNGDIGKLSSVNGTLQWKGTNISLNGHTHNYIVSRGNLNAQTGRTQSLGDVYSYNTVSGKTGGPTTYTSVIGFGRGTAGTVEIAGGWTSGMGLWYRALRDTTDNWYGWVKVWDSKNFDPNTKFNTSGGTISGAVTINNTLSVKSIKSTTTYSSNYVFCADGSIRNFPTLFSTNILWASYKVNTGGSGSYSRLSGNYSFITGRTREGTGRLIVTISVPSGYSKTQIMMFATGHHRQDHWENPVYASIQPDYGASNSVRVMTADDSSLNDAECIVNFILVKTS